MERAGGEGGQGLILDGRISGTDETFCFISNNLRHCGFECVEKAILFPPPILGS